MGIRSYFSAMADPEHGFRISVSKMARLKSRGSRVCLKLLRRKSVLPEGFDFEAHRELVPMQPGDVPVTYADTGKLERDTGFRPSTPLEDGLRAFARWYREYYGIGVRP